LTAVHLIHSCGKVHKSLSHKEKWELYKQGWNGIIVQQEK